MVYMVQYVTTNQLWINHCVVCIPTFKILNCVMQKLCVPRENLGTFKEERVK